MHISVFCGASLPHSEQITEAARQLGRAIARGIDGLFGCEVLAKQRLLISYKRQELILID